MNKKSDYLTKYRKNKRPLQVWVDKNIYREFKILCMEKGLKVNWTLMKLIVDFNRSSEIKTLK